MERALTCSKYEWEVPDTALDGRDSVDGLEVNGYVVEEEEVRCTQTLKLLSVNFFGSFLIFVPSGFFLFCEEKTMKKIGHYKNTKAQ